MDGYLGCGSVEAQQVKRWLEQERKRRALLEITGVDVGGTVVTVDFVGGYIEIDVQLGDARAWRNGDPCRLSDLVVPWRVLEIQLTVDAYCILWNSYQTDLSS